MSPGPARVSLALAALALLCPPAHGEGGDGRVDLPRFPSLSPDGAQIVFSWRGDLWKVASAGGPALRLTAHPGDDLHSAWSPDGKQIAFDSDRNGFLNLYLMNADGSDVRQVTRSDRPCTLQGFGVNVSGEPVLVLTATLEGDMFRSPRPYMVSLSGGDIVRLHDAFGTEAAVSPDGKRVAFTRGGSSWMRRSYRGPDNRDVWLANRKDGSFTRLTTWQGNDGQPSWAGADSILYLSDRELNAVNLYRMNVGKGEKSAARLTAFDKADVHSFDVSADGSMAALVAWDTLYTLDLRTAKAVPAALTITAAADEGDDYLLKSMNREVTEAALSPDGKVMACVAYGEVYVRNVEDKSPTRRVTESHARDRDIAWSPDGLRLYFVSDRDGHDSIYVATVALTRSQIKEQSRKALKPEEPAAEPDEPAAPAAEPPKPGTHLPPPTSPGPGPDSDATARRAEEPPAGTAPETPPAEEPKPAAAPSRPKTEPVDPALDPKRWHDAVTFDIKPLVKSDSNDRDPSPSPDGKHLAFRRGRGNLMIADLAADGSSGEARALVSGWDSDLRWTWSPDSHHIAYAQSDMDFNSDIWIIPADAADSKAAVNITRHPNNESSPRWSADGRTLAFLSQRIDDQYDVWAVYLDKSLEALTPKELDEYYKKEVDAAKKRKPLPVAGAKKAARSTGSAGRRAAAKTPAADEPKAEGDDAENGDADKEKEKPEAADKPSPLAGPAVLSLNDAYLRLRRITSLAGDEGNLQMTPAGDRIIFSAAIGDATNLYAIKWDGTERRQITGNVRTQHVSLTGDKVVFVSDGRAATASPAGRAEGGGAARSEASSAGAAGGGPSGGGGGGGAGVEFVDITDRIRIDLRQQASQKFREAARILGEEFYHPTMRDTDWPALTQRYHSLAVHTRTASEFNEVANRFVGELNASHLGVTTRDEPSPNRQPQGRLGTIHERVKVPAEGERGEVGGYRVVSVIAETPAAKAEIALKPGDVITAIEERPFESADTLESRLEGRVGRETIVTFIRTLEGGQKQTLRSLMTPIDSAAEIDLKQKAWERGSAEMVDQRSGGKIGYIHIEGMSQPSLDEFERDLYAAAHGRSGLIIDVRNNGGGWTTDRLLSSIMVQPHAYTMPRGGDPKALGHYPQDRLFIQRYTLPINMLCNEKSFSNAEIISHAFKTLKRGTLVGQQTYGGVISTGGTSLIDGTSVRLPARGWFLPDGTDMEMHGAMPDIVVNQTPDAESRNDDEQLKAAVDDLMKRVN